MASAGNSVELRGYLQTLMKHLARVHAGVFLEAVEYPEGEMLQLSVFIAVFPSSGRLR